MHHTGVRALKDLFLRGRLLIISVFFLAACVDGGGSTANNSGKPLQGIVMKGPVEASAVRLHTIQADGSRGSLLVDGGPFKTEQSPNDPLPGRWGAPGVDASVPLIVVARGGSYVDEGTQGTVKLLDREILGFKAPFSNPAVAVTPITHALLLQAKSQMLSGVAPADALKQVLTAASDSFGFNVVETQPRNPLQPPVNLTKEQKNYTALLGGLSNLLDPASNLKLIPFQQNVNSIDLVVAFAEDLADGNLDGKGLDANGNVLNAIPINDIDGAKVANFPALTTAANGIDVLFNAAYAWAQNSANLSTVNSVTFPTKALRFSGAATDFIPIITPSNGDRLNPVISWTGGNAVAIRVNRLTNTNPFAPAAWVIGGPGFTSPVTYYVTPTQGAFLRTDQMTNGGVGEQSLVAGVTYQIRVTLTDRTSGFVDYTP